MNRADQPVKAFDSSHYKERQATCNGNVVPSVIVDQNGVSQCSPTFVGTATVLAGTQLPSMVMGDGGSQLKVFGSAQVTCP